MHPPTDTAPHPPTPLTQLVTLLADVLDPVGVDVALYDDTTFSVPIRTTALVRLDQVTRCAPGHAPQRPTRGHPARVWARQHGHPVPLTGRLPRAALTAWRRAGSPTPDDPALNIDVEPLDPPPPEDPLWVYRHSVLLLNGRTGTNLPATLLDVLAALEDAPDVPAWDMADRCLYSKAEVPGFRFVMDYTAPRWASQVA